VLLIAEPPNLAIWSLVVATVGSMIAQWVSQFIKGHEERKAEEQRHNWELRDRQETLKYREETSAAMAQTNATIGAAATQINDGIHRVETKAEVAYETANHVNSKIANIAKVALKTRQDVEDRNVTLIRQDIFNLFHLHRNRPPEPDDDGKQKS
jgi:hypothetical protein